MLVALMQQFQWRDFAFFYTARRSELIPYCSFISDALTSVWKLASEHLPNTYSFQIVLRSLDLNISLVFKRNANNDSYELLRQQLGNIKPLARSEFRASNGLSIICSCRRMLREQPGQEEFPASCGGKRYDLGGVHVHLHGKHEGGIR